MSQPVVIMTQPGAVQAMCGKCRRPISYSRTEMESTCQTHCCALILCLIFFPLACVPYCTNTCKSPVTKCPNCDARI